MRLLLLLLEIRKEKTIRKSLAIEKSIPRDRGVRAQDPGGETEISKARDPHTPIFDSFYP